MIESSSRDSDMSKMVAATVRKECAKHVLQCLSGVAADGDPVGLLAKFTTPAATAEEEER